MVRGKIASESRWLRPLLLAISACGIVMFMALFAASFAKQDQVEAAAQGFIKYQIKTELTERYPGITVNEIPDGLKKLQNKYGAEADRIKVMMDAKLDRVIADAISEYCGDNCESKEERRDSFRKFFESQRESKSDISNKITGFIQGKYTQTLDELRREFRVFSSVNIIAFATVFLALLLKRRARVHLIVPSVLLILAALIAIYCYFFQQNWFFTLLHGSYWGGAYVVYMMIIYGFLLDIIMNRGRFTTFLLNGIGSVIGTVSVSIC